MTWLHLARSRRTLLSGAGLAVLGTGALTVSALVQPASAANSPMRCARS